ncbi:MAG: hypothetical protein GTO45_18485 [Candidatus Aminicenantes bacterium]|nr:hypothetical protein [Candidatus Aminicenantes bacterium]NIM80777.1 hypothetical protein [Candidatus Aminicenantes bacterium]NIN20159.1 hypothetical protein [Candidatus Aminicenantes bacterium]NIN43939.1 hypothetical protein [Candidatus Aminicenantes bacterium]NIN86748.1 hypothetical protein [Candidatus Aminicenantes bacterium]
MILAVKIGSIVLALIILLSTGTWHPRELCFLLRPQSWLYYFNKKQK